MDYRSLLLLRAARETGVIDAVTTDAATPREVAAQTGITERAADVTITVLESEGFLTFVEGEGYEPTNRMLGFLTTTDLRSIGQTPHLLDVADALVALPDAMRSGETPALPEDHAIHELGARRAEDEVVRARVTAAIREAPDADSVLVVGDGPGMHAQEFTTRGTDVTLVETPTVLERVESLLAHEPIDLETRATTDPLPRGFDLVFVPRAFRSRGPDANRKFVDRVRDALPDGGHRDGGTAVFVDVFGDVGDDDYASIAAELLATTDAGRVYEAADARSWLSAAGLGDVRSVPVPGTGEGAVIGAASFM